MAGIVPGTVDLKGEYKWFLIRGAKVLLGVEGHQHSTFTFESANLYLSTHVGSTVVAAGITEYSSQQAGQSLGIGSLCHSFLSAGPAQLLWVSLTGHQEGCGPQPPWTHTNPGRTGESRSWGGTKLNLGREWQVRAGAVVGKKGFGEEILSEWVPEG